MFLSFSLSLNLAFIYKFMYIHIEGKLVNLLFHQKSSLLLLLVAYKNMERYKIRIIIRILVQIIIRIQIPIPIPMPIPIPIPRQPPPTAPPGTACSCHRTLPCGPREIALHRRNNAVPSRIFWNVMISPRDFWKGEVILSRISKILLGRLRPQTIEGRKGDFLPSVQTPSLECECLLSDFPS